MVTKAAKISTHAAIIVRTESVRLGQLADGRAVTDCAGRIKSNEVTQLWIHRHVAIDRSIRSSPRAAGMFCQGNGLSIANQMGASGHGRRHAFAKRRLAL